MSTVRSAEQQLVAPVPPYLPQVLCWVRTEGRDGDSRYGMAKTCCASPCSKKSPVLSLNYGFPQKLCKRVRYVWVLVLGQVTLKAKPFWSQGSGAGYWACVCASKLFPKRQRCVSVGAAASHEHYSLRWHKICPFVTLLWARTWFFPSAAVLYKERTSLRSYVVFYSLHTINKNNTCMGVYGFIL